MANLSDIFSIEEFNKARAEGLVRVQHHPSEPLAILNYTEKCAWGKEWSSVTLQCRGLVYNTETLDIVARPFPKFFNYEQVVNDPSLLTGTDLANLFTQRCIVTDKCDGSLGILGREPNSGEPFIATRGSFTSEQAIHATARFRNSPDCMTWFHEYCNPEFTELFEIVYPANRIVLDYGHRDELIYLGSVDIESGATYPPGANDSEEFPFSFTETFPCRTLEEALKMPPRENAEGLVVHFVQADVRVKLKQADYLRLHRIVTNTTARSVWEALQTGGTLEEFLDNVPDEFHDWVTYTAQELEYRFSAWITAARSAYLEVLKSMNGAVLEQQLDRKTFAQLASKSEYRAALFRLLDGKDITGMAWKAIKPEAERPFKAVDPSAD